MAPENEIMNEVETAQGGKIIFAPDVIATIAALAAAEVDGVDGMAATVVEGISGMLSSKKNMTKGVKVEVGEEQATVEISVIVKYGHRLHEVCSKVQNGIKNAIETMTGLRVTQVNVLVQSVTFDKAEPKKIEEPPAEG